VDDNGRAVNGLVIGTDRANADMAASVPSAEVDHLTVAQPVGGEFSQAAFHHFAPQKRNLPPYAARMLGRDGRTGAGCLGIVIAAQQSTFYAAYLLSLHHVYILM
jgi:hypothetical protein